MTTTTQTTHPSASIYVGDLNNDVSEGLLFEIFKRVGTVNSIRVCRDSVTKRSLGYAYVNFVNYDDARRAIDTLNNTSIKGRACRIMWSTRDPSSRKSGVGNIFIRGLDESIGPKELHDTFSQFGNIISCKVVSYPNGKSKGYGYVHFENQSNAEQAIKIVHGRRMGENVVYVTPFIPRSERQKRIEQTWTNVFVKNLDINYTEQDLRNLFGNYGEVDSCILLKKENIDAKYGFVNFKNHQDAVVAVEKLNNSQVGDKVIICCRAQKKTERQSELRKLYEIKRRERIHKYQGLNVYVKNIEDHVTEDKLRKEFEQYGNIINLTIMVNESTGASKGFGFVCYSTPEEAQKAIAEIGKNKILPGCTKPLYVAIHEPREVRQQRFTRNRNPKIQQPIYQSQPGPVFYNQGYPPMMRGPNNWPQGNPQFSGNFVQGQRGGRGGARGGGRGGGNMGKTRVEMSELQSLPLNRQKDLLGEQLFKRIEDKEPSLASKITGMIIHSQDFSVGSVVEIINDEEKLDSIIRDAKSFLEQNQQPEGDVNETN